MGDLGKSEEAQCRVDFLKGRLRWSPVRLLLATSSPKSFVGVHEDDLWQIKVQMKECIQRDNGPEYTSMNCRRSRPSGKKASQTAAGDDFCWRLKELPGTAHLDGMLVRWPQGYHHNLFSHTHIYSREEGETTTLTPPSPDTLMTTPQSHSSTSFDHTYQ